MVLFFPENSFLSHYVYSEYFLNFNLMCKCSVSSVLNKDVKQHGKGFMFDGLEDTAWYSDQVNFVNNLKLDED